MTFFWIGLFDSCYLNYTQFDLTFRKEQTYYGITFANPANYLAKYYFSRYDHSSKIALFFEDKTLTAYSTCHISLDKK